MQMCDSERQRKKKESEKMSGIMNDTCQAAYQFAYFRYSWIIRALDVRKNFAGIFLAL